MKEHLCTTVNKPWHNCTGKRLPTVERIRRWMSGSIFGTSQSPDRQSRLYWQSELSEFVACHCCQAVVVPRTTVAFRDMPWYSFQSLQGENKLIKKYRKIKDNSCWLRRRDPRIDIRKLPTTGSKLTVEDASPDLADWFITDRVHPRHGERTEKWRTQYTLSSLRHCRTPRVKPNGWEIGRG